MKHFVVTIVLLGVTAFIHQGIQRSHRIASEMKPSVDVLNVPATIGEYTQVGDDINVGEDVKDQLQTSAILMRNYRSRSGRPVQLTIVYAGTTRRSLHFPEVCLVGQGWEIRGKANLPVGFYFTASKLELVKGNSDTAVLYWYKTGDRFTGNFFENSWHWALEQLTNGKATSAMIRISTPIIPGDAQSYVVLEDFATKLTPVLLDCLD